MGAARQGRSTRIQGRQVELAHGQRTANQSGLFSSRCSRSNVTKPSLEGERERNRRSGKKNQKEKQEKNGKGMREDEGNGGN